MLSDKKILIGVTGSIAAYKTAFLIRLLVKAGAEVKVIMTKAACEFISPLTLGTLAKSQVLTDLSEGNTWANHVMLGRWADIMVVAPLSCNTLSRMAHGSCDNLLQAVYLSATSPVAVAPAMDEDMWAHKSTVNNLALIESFGNKVIPVNSGELASGLFGNGRMAEPEEIVAWLNDYFAKSKQLAGKKILITAGPTHEAIDPVRFIGNASSGKMGIAIAKEVYNRGADVTLVAGPIKEQIPAGISTIRVTNAEEMFDACMTHFPESDWAIMNAAVADYTPANFSSQKIKKKEEELVLHLKKTKDILAELGARRSPHQCVVGFALETNNEVESARAKLVSKKADIIVLNSLQDLGAGFGYDTNKVTIFDNKGGEYSFDKKSKQAIATDIINTIINYTND